MAFVRRKGNAYYLVHNVRRAGKVRQLHLARLGERPRITPEVIREVRRRHPLLELDWERVREQASRQSALSAPDPDALKALVERIRALHGDLAELVPAWLAFSAGAEQSWELASLLKLLHATLEIKLRQFDKLFAPGPGGQPQWRKGRVIP